MEGIQGEGVLTGDPSGACCPIARQGSLPSSSKLCSLLFPLPAQVRSLQENLNKLGQWALD